MMINVNKIGFDENVQVVSNTQWSVFHRQGATWLVWAFITPQFLYELRVPNWTVNWIP